MIYYRIVTDHQSQIEPIEEEAFRAAVGETPHDCTADFSAIKEPTRAEYLRRALANHTASGLPVATVSVWRLDEETGKAEGWVIAARKNGKRVGDES